MGIEDGMGRKGKIENTHDARSRIMAGGTEIKIDLLTAVGLGTIVKIEDLMTNEKGIERGTGTVKDFGMVLGRGTLPVAQLRLVVQPGHDLLLALNRLLLSIRQSPTSLPLDSSLQLPILSKHLMGQALC